MTPNVRPNAGRLDHPINMAAALDVVLGVWLFISPWVYGAYMKADAWNSWIIGVLIATLAIIRIATRVASVSWMNTILGVWVFASPWIYAYTANTGRFVNSLCVGLLVFILSMSASTRAPRAVTH